MSKQDGGNTFPYVSENENGMCNVTRGMSLRDWYAGLAMQGLMASDKTSWAMYKEGDIAQTSHVVKAAFTIADAMIAERSKV